MVHQEVTSESSTCCYFVSSFLPSFLYFLVKKTANTNEMDVDSCSEAAEKDSGVGRVRVL